MQITFYLSICQSLILLIQLGSALTLNSTNREWIDLGSHREACMIIPETCLWMNTSECVSDGVGGFVTTKMNIDDAGLNILFYLDRLW